MLEHLEKFIFELAQGNLEEAKKAHSLYANAKAKAIMEDAGKEEELEPALVKGHCDSCGEEATTNKNILAGKRWECGKCGGKTFTK